MRRKDFHLVQEGLGLEAEVPELNVEGFSAVVVDEIDINRAEAARSPVRRDGERHQDDEDDDGDDQMDAAADFGANIEARAEAERLELDLVRFRLPPPFPDHFAQVVQLKWSTVGHR